MWCIIIWVLCKLTLKQIWQPLFGSPACCAVIPSWLVSKFWLQAFFPSQNREAQHLLAYKVLSIHKEGSKTQHCVGLGSEMGGKQSKFVLFCSPPFWILMYRRTASWKAEVQQAKWTDRYPCIPGILQVDLAYFADRSTLGSEYSPSILSEFYSRRFLQWETAKKTT